MIDNLLALQGLGIGGRISLVILIAFGAHFLVYAIRHLTQRLLSVDAMRRWTKLRTLAGLATSALIFMLYFVGTGLVLNEFGVSLTAYLASASIIGLAIGFGSQGVVQDVVTGLTVILSDLFQVGDLVEISGQVGEVHNISMRFTTLLNPLGATMFIPNRTLSSVILYPRGYLRCYADIRLPDEDTALGERMIASIDSITRGFVEQYPGIMRHAPETAPVIALPAGRRLLRVKFRIWPGRGAPIDGVYKNEVVQTLKSLDPNYADWMVSINNEVSEVPRPVAPFRRKAGRARAPDQH